MVRFDISGAANSTTLELLQTGYPDDAAAHLEPGWHKMYWEPLRAYLA